MPKRTNINHLYHQAFGELTYKLMKENSNRNIPSFGIDRHGELFHLEACPTPEESRKISRFIGITQKEMLEQTQLVQTMINTRSANILSGHKPFSFRIDTIPMVSFRDIMSHRKRRVTRAFRGRSFALRSALNERFGTSSKAKYIALSDSCSNSKKCSGSVFYEFIDDAVYFECGRCRTSWGTVVDPQFNLEEFNQESIDRAVNQPGFVMVMSQDSIMTTDRPTSPQIRTDFYDEILLKVPLFKNIVSQGTVVVRDDYVEYRLTSQDCAKRAFAMFELNIGIAPPKLQAIWAELKWYAEEMSKDRYWDTSTKGFPTPATPLASAVFLKMRASKFFVDDLSKELKVNHSDLRDFLWHGNDSIIPPSKLAEFLGIPVHEVEKMGSVDSNSSGQDSAHKKRPYRKRVRRRPE